MSLPGNILDRNPPLEALHQAISVGDPLANVKLLYASHDWPSVCSYLERHPQVSQELTLSHQAILTIFANERKARLQIQTAPDNDGPPMLVVYIPMTNGADDAFQRMEQFDEWCLDNLLVGTSVIFDVEFC